jgi:hypothetical protein
MVPWMMESEVENQLFHFINGTEECIEVTKKIKTPFVMDTYKF